jgi:SAM-dependent methyltransferase
VSAVTLAYDGAPGLPFAPPENLAGRDCPLCGGSGLPVGERDGYPLRECCGVLLSWQWRDEESYHRLYTEGCRYHQEQQLREGQLPYSHRDAEALAAAESRLDVLQLHAPRRSSLLDVGCATGALVHAAAARGLTTRGLDPNAEMVRLAQASSRPVALGGWQAAAGRWDVITLLDVLEHLTRPLPCLQRLRAHLTPGGTLVVEWPEWDCPAARAQGLGWKHVRPLQHVCLYSDSAARALFGRAGLHVRSHDRPVGGALGIISYYLAPTA